MWLGNLRSIPHFEKKFLFVDQKILDVVRVELVDNILDEIFDAGVFDAWSVIDRVCACDLHILIHSELEEKFEDHREKQEWNDSYGEKDYEGTERVGAQDHNNSLTSCLDLIFGHHWEEILAPQVHIVEEKSFVFVK